MINDSDFILQGYYAIYNYKYIRTQNKLKEIKDKLSNDDKNLDNEFKYIKFLQLAEKYKWLRNYAIWTYRNRVCNKILRYIECHYNDICNLKSNYIRTKKLFQEITKGMVTSNWEYKNKKLYYIYNSSIVIDLTLCFNEDNTFIKNIPPDFYQEASLLSPLQAYILHKNRQLYIKSFLENHNNI